MHQIKYPYLLFGKGDVLPLLLFIFRNIVRPCATGVEQDVGLEIFLLNIRTNIVDTGRGAP
jgi:hypothetical protein